MSQWTCYHLAQLDDEHLLITLYKRASDRALEAVDEQVDTATVDVQLGVSSILTHGSEEHDNAVPYTQAELDEWLRKMKKLA